MQLQLQVKEYVILRPLTRHFTTHEASIKAKRPAQSLCKHPPSGFVDSNLFRISCSIGKQEANRTVQAYVCMYTRTFVLNLLISSGCSLIALLCCMTSSFNLRSFDQPAAYMQQTRQEALRLKWFVLDTDVMQDLLHN